jgi:hypothetical protein
MQISENSDQYDEVYDLIDLICYPSKKGGFPHGTLPISSHYERILSESYVQSDVDVAPQLRLLISNRYTLNPYGALVVRRWDLYDAATISGYEDEMRQYIRNMHYDADKAQIYKQNLLELWNQ